MNATLVEALADALGRAATVLPTDVVRELEAARGRESGPARIQLEAILRNVEVAREKAVPICQDTGTLTYFVEFGVRFPLLAELKEALVEAARLATESVPLRPNTVDPLTGANPGDNTGLHIPAVTWEPRDGDDAEVHILPKGGGSENCSALVMLTPSAGLKGILETVADHVVAREGKPCPPTVIGVGIGGGADLAMKLGKRALLRPVGTRHREPQVAAIEEKLERLINASGVGPMGLGGETTTLAVHVEYAHRHPASLPVGIAVQCWADRRAAVRIGPDGSVTTMA